ncbi:MAG TPA: amidohydrolase [Runella sp.]|nr:amidohydrolase [Runella sp.]HAO48398.1 amidohydrolase [Runella sp.]
MKNLQLLFCLVYALTAVAQQREPIIDVHLHSYDRWPSDGRDTTWYPPQFRIPATSAELMSQSLQALRDYNIVKAFASGSIQNVDKWKAAAPDRIVEGYQLSVAPTGAVIEQLRQRIQAGKLMVLAELSIQYAGLSPTDSSMTAFYRLAEEYDIPIGIHMGLGPSGAAYFGKYRSKLSNPLLLEEVLIRHPKLRIYVMHAGWPMLDDMVAMLYAFPNLYVDVGVINWYIPQPEFYTYLKRLVDAGFSKRIMYGSDQMEWPQAIGASIKAIENAPFLTKEQKRDIFYNNAVRFFRLDK